MPVAINPNQNVGINVTIGSSYTSRMKQLKDNDVIMITGISERGPVNQATRIRSFNEYLLRMGSYVEGGQMYQAADLIFNAYAKRVSKQPEVAFCRVVGPGATKASVMLKDTNGVDTLKVEAKDPNRIPYFITIGAGADKKTIDPPYYNPVLTSASTGGTVADGTYEITYTYKNSNGETTLGRTMSIAVADGTSTSAITVKSPNYDDELPWGVDGIQTYVKVSGNWRKSTASTGGANTAIITAIPEAGDDETPAANTCKLDTFNIGLYENSQHIFGADMMTLSPTDITWFNENQDRINLINQDSTSAFNERNPATLTTKVAMTGGEDDIANITESTIVGTIAASGDRTGLKVFDQPAFENGIMITPGFTSSAIHEELERQCDIFHRVAYIDLAYDTDYEELIAWRAASNIDNRHLALAWPCARTWMNTDPRLTGGFRQWISTSIDMAASLWTTQHSSAGLFSTNAGDNGILPLCPRGDKEKGIIGGLYKDIYGNDLVRNKSHSTDIGANLQVVSIINEPGQGPTIWDNVMLTTTDVIFNEIHRVRGINYFYYLVMNNLKRKGFLFQTLSGRNIKAYEARIVGTIEQSCEFMRRQDIFTGVSSNGLTDDPATAYAIETGVEYNNLTSLDRGEFYVAVFVRLSPAIKFITAQVEGRGLADQLG